MKNDQNKINETIAKIENAFKAIEEKESVKITDMVCKKCEYRSSFKNVTLPMVNCGHVSGHEYTTIKDYLTSIAIEDLTISERAEVINHFNLI